MIFVAQDNNAPQDFLEELKGLGEGQFSSSNEVLTEMGIEHQEEQAESKVELYKEGPVETMQNLNRTLDSVQKEPST